jgi:hypothetical protein
MEAAVPPDLDDLLASNPYGAHALPAQDPWSMMGSALTNLGAAIPGIPYLSQEP